MARTPRKEGTAQNATGAESDNVTPETREAQERVEQKAAGEGTGDEEGGLVPASQTPAQEAMSQGTGEGDDPLAGKSAADKKALQAQFDDADKRAARTISGA